MLKAYIRSHSPRFGKIWASSNQRGFFIFHYGMTKRNSINCITPVHSAAERPKPTESKTHSPSQKQLNCELRTVNIRIQLPGGVVVQVLRSTL
jgi:hypothetical protein